MYDIRQATAEDWPSIAAFIERTYGASAPFKRRERWDWQFRNTPYPPEAGNAVPVWIALYEGAVVGQLALQPSLLRLGGERIPVGWIVDVMVDPAHRGRGLSHRINDAIVASGRTSVTLTMAAATRSIMERAGCVTLPPVHQMVRAGGLSGPTIAVLLGRIAENRARWRKPIGLFVDSRLGPALLARGLSAAAWLLQGRGGGRTKLPIEDVAAPDPRLVDRLAARLAAGSGAGFDRSAAFYAWRFGGAPDLDYEYAASGHGEQARSILVWRLPLPVELPVGTIVDILCDPDDGEAIAASIDAAIARMAGRCEAIIAGASDPRFVGALAKAGFVTVKKHHPTVVTSDRALLARIAAHDGGWHFSKADHDWDQVHPAEH